MLKTTKNYRPNQNKFRNDPLLYEGIQFKSRLEVYTYRKLKELKVDFEYEPRKFEIFPGFVTEVIIHSKTPKLGYRETTRRVNPITYTPDFIIKLNNKIIIIECKGRENDAFPLKEKLFLACLPQVQDYAGKELFYFKPTNQANVLETIKLIQNLDTDDRKKVDNYVNKAVYRRRIS